MADTATKTEIKANATTRLNTVLTSINDAMLDLICDEIIEIVTLDLGWSAVPADLLNTVGGMVAGRYLLQLSTNSTTAEEAGLSMGASVSSISEGDLNVSFSSDGSDASNIKTLADKWANPSRALFARFRRLI